jgi:hypothetical protein
MNDELEKKKVKGIRRSLFEANVIAFIFRNKNIMITGLWPKI